MWTDNDFGDPRADDMTELTQRLMRCATLIEQADGLLITAGAGIGVDTGLPDFRGNEGFWRAYPALGRARLQFQDIACPEAFRAHPRLAWGFYGHRLGLYRRTDPGPTLHILREIALRVPDGAFVFTSNVDGQCQKAGLVPGQVVECHGSIHHMQCLDACMGEVWSADSWIPEVDDCTCMLLSDLPTCPHCGGLARPAILMFGDSQWIDRRLRAQLARLHGWRNKVERLLVIEVGAGTAIPSVRIFGEGQDAPIIRINSDEAKTDADRGVSLAMRGIDAMQGIASVLIERGFLDCESCRTPDLAANGSLR
jgi:NAD-dependent SIR2 family protein deacetylase